MEKILIADSDADCRAKILKGILECGWRAEEACDGIDALKKFRRAEFDLVILEYEMPELSGIPVCRQIRKISAAPILFLSSKSQQHYKMECFDAGGDDFITKPFSLQEIIARIGVFLKWARGRESRTILMGGGITLNTESREVRTDDRLVQLSPREYGLLLYLMQNKNIVLSRSQILDEAWGDEYEGTDRTVDTHVRSLRERLSKPYSKAICTVWGVGYKFME